MKSNKKTLIILGIATATTVIFGAMYAFLFFTVKGKTEATAVLSEKIDELSGRESRIASSVAVIKTQGENIDKLSAYFFKASEVVAFTKKIEELGAMSNTTLKLESLEQGATEKSVPYLNFRVKASGSFDQVMRLVVLLENFPGKIEWKTLRLSADTSTPEPALPGAKLAKGAIRLPQ